jgi:DNA-cytosine methyltransferase
MKVLSLFDGISAGRVALDRAGIQVDVYYASEIDAHAMKVAQKNYPNTIQIGDATKWRDWDIDFSSIDLIMAGFPCQSWSIAGQQGGVDDERGQLLHTMMDILHHIQEKNPNLKFLFENVKMKKVFQEYVNRVIGVEPIVINSKLVSAQNRPRQYWTNIPNVVQPNDKGIILKDIIVQDLSDDKIATEMKKMILSDTARDYMSRLRNGKPRWEYHTNPLDGKAACLTANMYKGVPYGVVKELGRRLHPVECERLQTFPDGYTDGVSTTQRFKALGNSWTVDVIAHIFKGLK